MNPTGGIVLGVSEFVDYLNQTMEMAFPYVELEGELSNFKISKNKWLYFDLKDETASLRCFGTVYSLPGPLEDGMMVRVAGAPRLHPMFNFSFNVQSIVPVGEGALKRAADLLARKLEAEGLFEPARKRPLPFPPQRIALITAGDSAAYADFMKITKARWGGLDIVHHNVLVQGEQSPAQIVAAIKQANEAIDLPGVIVLIRGGGSADDLAAFSDERVVRAVAASRVPTLVAIGHEIDTSLAERAADMHASTPSNAAELLVPDRKTELRQVRAAAQQLDEALRDIVTTRREQIQAVAIRFDEQLQQKLRDAMASVGNAARLLIAYNPRRPLVQGYAMVRDAQGDIVTARRLHPHDRVQLEFSDGSAQADIINSTKDKE